MPKPNQQKTRTTNKDLVKRKKQRQYLLLLSACIVLLGIIAIIRPTRSDRSTLVSQPKATVLSAFVGWNKSEFIIGNTENRTWQRCQFTVNREDAGGYSLTRSEVAAGDVIKLPYEKFRSSSSKTYDFISNPPQSFLIRCSNVNGQVGLFLGTPKSS